LIEPIDVLEALLFASDAPVEAAAIQDVLELPSADAARELVAALRARLAQQGALQVIEAGGGFRLVTRPEVAPWLVRLARSKTKTRLSRPALETLAIIAYRQPVSRPEVDATRGVNSEGVLDNLLERRLVRIAGRKESPGRPFLYETTREFLVAFGLRDLGDLPKVDGDLVVLDPAAAGAAAGSEESGDAAPVAETLTGEAESIVGAVDSPPDEREAGVAGVEASAADVDSAVDIAPAAAHEQDASGERDIVRDAAATEIAVDAGDRIAAVESATAAAEPPLSERPAAVHDLAGAQDHDMPETVSRHLADATADERESAGAAEARPSREVGQIAHEGPIPGGDRSADAEEPRPGEHPAQQDPRAGGTDVATGS
jgi:segregation and condensation protein B